MTLFEVALTLVQKISEMAELSFVNGKDSLGARSFYKCTLGTKSYPSTEVVFIQ